MKCLACWPDEDLIMVRWKDKARSTDYCCPRCGRFWKYSELVQQIEDGYDKFLSSPPEIEEEQA